MPVSWDNVVLHCNLQMQNASDAEQAFGILHSDIEHLVKGWNQDEVVQLPFAWQKDVGAYQPSLHKKINLHKKPNIMIIMSWRKNQTWPWCLKLWNHIKSRRYVKLEEQQNCQTPFGHKAVDRASIYKRNKTSKKKQQYLALYNKNPLRFQIYTKSIGTKTSPSEWTFVPQLTK